MRSQEKLMVPILNSKDPGKIASEIASEIIIINDKNINLLYKYINYFCYWLEHLSPSLLQCYITSFSQF